MTNWHSQETAPHTKAGCGNDLLPREIVIPFYHDLTKIKETQPGYVQNNNGSSDKNPPYHNSPVDNRSFQFPLSYPSITSISSSSKTRKLLYTF